MTAESQIDAGPETDRRVAEAVGLAITEPPLNLGYESCWVTAEENSSYYTREFRPSKYWNHAMLAAERFGLFAPGKAHLRQALDDETGERLWIVHHELGYKHERTLGYAETGPLAIARAILILSAVSPTQVSN